jgi:alanyl-tRNA synthetase
MTERLYYTDARLRTFDATVRSAESRDGRTAVVLDRTAFYPTSGGQPFDIGRLGDAEVVDVIDEGDEIVHVTTTPGGVGATVRGEVAWGRRFDHMQQHTGQHILSAAFEHASGARTVSFHLGAEVSTIDLHREVSQSEIARAESDANDVVWGDRALVVRTVDAAEAARLPLRRETERSGPVRLVEVPDFDLSACGGTHVSRTGEVGLIAVAATERFKGGTRVTFVCGRRALASHGRLRDTVTAAGRLLSVAPADIASTIERLQSEAKARDKNVEELFGELVQYRAAALRATSETIGPLSVVLRMEPTADVPGLKALAQAVVAGEAGLVAIVVGQGEPAPVVAARSNGVAFDAGAFIKSATAALGGRGGGRPELAQAGIAAKPDAVLAFARTAIG